MHRGASGCPTAMATAQGKISSRQRLRKGKLPMSGVRSEGHSRSEGKAS